MSQENVREIIKIEEMDSLNSDDGYCMSGITEDSKDVYTFQRDGYMT